MRRHGTDTVDDACRRALDAEVVDVGVIDRMLTRGSTGRQLTLLPPPAPSRFVRSTTDFSIRTPS
ncbi:hypothetical protein [Nocardia brevicatena]|uniref:hypothetical protein n=1 Tax=Nocardia brevicatena TaxID=37327 RepID=UPI000312059A|nr:hypothetical protein [Nocardia brevicatena]